MDPQLIQDCLDFLNQSPGCYHAAANLAARLEAAGHTPLREEAPWNLSPGMRYYIEREGSILAF
ncbi:MAG: M18 family aminopeptidase, partial [Oscillibacter sp.]|nr:M18 family aminopeptidase [Oscillibacter sp.]